MDTQSLPGPVSQSICRGCEYDLTGLSAPGICPECGREFSELASDERIELDWSCLRCGYSLLGLRRNQKCSECGMLAVNSLDPTHFRFQPSAYRRRVKSGALFAGLGILSMFVFPLVIMMFSLALFATAPTGSALPDLAMSVASIAATGLFCYGWFRILATPPVTMALTGRQLRMGSIARWALILWLAVTIVTTILGFSVASFAAGSGLGMAAMPLSQLISLLSFGTFFVLGLLYLRPLFLRAHSTGKAPGSIAMVTLVLGAVSLVGFVFSAIALVAAAFVAPAGGTPAAGNVAIGFGVVAVLAGLCAIITFFCYLGTTESLRGALKRVERDIAVAHRSPLRTGQPGTGETPGGVNPNNKAP
jgi:hypothetical protein